MENINPRQLTNEERRQFRKQQQEKEDLLRIRKAKIKKALFVFLPAVLIVSAAAAAIVRYSAPKETVQGDARVEMELKEYDFGDISMAAGPVEKTFEIKNVGTGDLRIDDIWTSCHCTTAVLKVGGKESQRFGMERHFNFWSQKILPRQSGYLEVTFDPAFHGPSGMGQALRAVYLSTNDAQNKKVEVRLLANVIK